MKKTALLFPGQGSQYVGMGKELYEKYQIAREIFEEANDVLGFDLKKICFDGSMDELTRTVNTQPAMLTMSIALYRVFLQEFGFNAEYFVGHSLGEISALTCSGAIKFADALKITRKRGEFMQEAVNVGSGAMSAISQVNVGMIEEECRRARDNGKVVVISNYNSPEQTVISGYTEAVEYVGKRLAEVGAKVIPLKVSAPFHSPLMNIAADKLRSELKKYKYDEMKYKVISNVTSLPYNGSGYIIENLSMQITCPVNWQTSMEFLVNNGIEAAIELGPKNVLKNLMRINAPSIKVYSYDYDKDVTAMRQEFNSNYQIINSGTKLISRCLAIAVCTRNFNWDNDQYQSGVVDSYKKCQNLLDDIESNNRKPTIEEMKSALIMLRSVFITKKTSMSEQLERFEQLLIETGTKHMLTDYVNKLY